MTNHTFDLADGIVYTPGGIVNRGVLRVRDGVIQSVVPMSEWTAESAEAEVRDAQGATIVPGFIDVHVHGGGGGDVMDARASDLDTIAKYHASRGTTAWLATTLTAPHRDLVGAVRAIVERIKQGGPGAELAGIHMEGPYLNPEHCGAQNPEYLRLPEPSEIEVYLRLAEGHLRLMTLAPELPGGIEAIRLLRQSGVTVSIGHSDADFDMMKEALQAGASHVTHLFNGSRRFHHREPGVVGAALMMPEFAVELICDGVHLHPELIPFVMRCKPADKTVLITDCIAASGMPDGIYSLGGLPAQLAGGVMKLIRSDGSEGSLAGSTLTLDQALRNAISWTGRSLSDVLPSVTANPARQASLLSRKGTIEPGKDADFVLLDDGFQVMETWVRGQLEFKR